MAQLKLIRKKDEITALNGKVIDSLDSNSSIDAPSIRSVNEHFGNISNANMLINGDFRRPINQRGKTTYNIGATWTYTVDRWRGKNVNVVVNASSITVTAGTSGGNFQQMLENALPSGDYIVSANVLNVTGTVYLYSNSGTKLTTGVNTRHLNSSITVTQMQLYLEAGASIEIEWIKLEPGTVATPFVPRLVAEELALCQRYYEKRTILFFPYGGATPTTYFIAVNGDSHHVPKRVTPTLTVSALTDHNNNAISSNYVSATQSKDSIRMITVDPAYDKWLIRTDIAFDAEIY